MTLLIRTFLACAFIAGLHHDAFSQNSSAQTYYDSGILMTDKDPGQAFQLLSKAMHFSIRVGDTGLYIESVNKLAGLDFQNNREKDSLILDAIKRAVRLQPKSKKTDAVARLHFNAGEIYRKLTNEIDLPLNHYETAKNIWQFLGDKHVEAIASCYHGMGDIYKYKKNDFLEAEKAYETALQLREAIEFNNMKLLFANYYSLATTNRSQRDFEKALSYGSKTLDIANRLQGSIYKEMTNGVIAGIYRDMRESKLAKKHYQIAISLNQKTRDIQTLAWYYQGLGETLKNDSSYDEAIKNFSKAYGIYTKEKVSPSLLVYLLQLIADTYALMGDQENFYRAMRELFGEFNSLGMMKSRQSSEAYTIFGNYHVRNKNYDSALYYYQQALIATLPFHSEKIEDNPSEDSIGFQFYVYGIISKKASVWKNKFLADRNPTFYREAIECLQLSEKLLSHERNMLDMEDAKWKFLEDNYDIYEEIISLLYEGKEIVARDSLYSLAFQYFERSKSRTLAVALGQTERTLQITQDDSLFNIHSELRRKLLGIQDKLASELERSDNARNISKFRAQIVDVDRDIQICKSSIEEKYPGYFNVKYGYQSASLNKVIKHVKSDRVILEYFWGMNWVYVLTIHDGGVSFDRIGKPERIRQNINSVLSHFDVTNSSIDYEEYQKFTTNAHHLYRTLIEPVNEIIWAKRHIQIIPDGPIGQIPFEILITEKVVGNFVDYRSLKYMIKSHTIGYAYSSSMLLRDQKKVIRNPSFLAIGLTSGANWRGNSEMVEIAGSEEELDLLEKQFGDGNFLTGQEATETNFKRLSPKFDIIHLAIHGRGDIRKNFGASLYFKSDNNSVDDGELHAYELYGLKLNVSMAVLTACESGLGRGYKGEGMISMASAFTYSGCDNILMSLWKVNDQASITLMDNFYRHLLIGGSIDEALREAKLNYLESADELTADPKVWAPMVAYGRLNKIFPNNSVDIYLVLGIIILSIVIFAFSKKSRRIGR